MQILPSSNEHLSDDADFAPPSMEHLEEAGTYELAAMLYWGAVQSMKGPRSHVLRFRGWQKDAKSKARSGMRRGALPI